MLLVNETPFHVIHQVADLLDVRLAAVVIVKSTFDLCGGDRLLSSAEQVPLVADIAETPFGVFHGEHYFKKRGADLCVLGSVRRQEPVTSAHVRLRVGPSWAQELLVVGDRVWLPGASPGELRAGPPRPFTQLPLGYEYAYGGAAEYNGEAAPYPENPVGRGFYHEAAQAEGKPLPNIEGAAGPPVRTWADRPPVAGWGPYPSYWGLRAATCVEVDRERSVVTRIDPGVNNHAHPDLVFDALPPRCPIRIEGLHDAPIAFTMPEPPAAVEIVLGGVSGPVPAPIDGVFVWADAGKVVFTQRARFDYEFRPEEVRRVAVKMRDGRIGVG